MQSDLSPIARAVRPAPRRVVVLGDGQVGVTAAIALRRAYPRTDVLVVATPRDPAALADRALTSLPRSVAFQEELGFDEAGLLTRCGASHRLAVRYKEWRGDDADWVVAYGAPISAALRSAFQREWGHRSVMGQTDGVRLHSTTQALAESERFAVPQDDPASPMSDIDYALRWNGPAYHARLVSLAQHMGVGHVAAPLVAHTSDGAGGIAALQFADGQQIGADLFVDCSGPKSVLHSKLPDAAFESWADMLPCDRILFDDGSAEPGLSLEDRFVACSVGWAWQMPSRDAVHSGFAYAACQSTDAEAAAAFQALTGAAPAQMVQLNQGRMRESWIGNVIAIGDASACFEPLHWLNLHLAHRQIELLLELIPGVQMDALERAEFNRRANASADRVRDWIAAHYCAAQTREGAFWHFAAQQKRSAELTLTLDQFGRRARIPFFEEQSLSNADWVAVLSGIGIVPSVGAAQAALPPSALQAQQNAQAQRCAAALAASVPYAQWLSNQLGQRS
jgi:tryptophan 7-halogenase